MLATSKPQYLHYWRSEFRFASDLLCDFGQVTQISLQISLDKGICSQSTSISRDETLYEMQMLIFTAYSRLMTAEILIPHLSTDRIDSQAAFAHFDNV